MAKHPQNTALDPFINSLVNRNEATQSYRLLESTSRIFRGFSPENTYPIRLRPITLIFGPNNGGKSTILKAVANPTQSAEISKLSGNQTSWASEGHWFDLGGPNNQLFKGQGEGFG